MDGILRDTKLPAVQARDQPMFRQRDDVLVNALPITIENRLSACGHFGRLEM